MHISVQISFNNNIAQSSYYNTSVIFGNSLEKYLFCFLWIIVYGYLSSEWIQLHYVWKKTLAHKLEMIIYIFFEKVKLLHLVTFENLTQFHYFVRSCPELTRIISFSTMVFVKSHIKRIEVFEMFHFTCIYENVLNISNHIKGVNLCRSQYKI